MDHSTRLLSWGHEQLSNRARSGITIERREALTQQEIEQIASQTRFFVPPVESMQLPTFAELAARCEAPCACGVKSELRKRGRQEQPNTECVCHLLGAMSDRFGGETAFLALLERLLLEPSASPCVRRAAASALGDSKHAKDVRRRARGQLQRRVEWEGRSAAQLELISRLG